MWVLFVSVFLPVCSAMAQGTASAGYACASLLSAHMADGHLDVVDGFVRENTALLTSLGWALVESRTVRTGMARMICKGAFAELSGTIGPVAACQRGSGRSAVLMGMGASLGLAHEWFVGDGPVLAKHNACWKNLFDPLVTLSRGALALEGVPWANYLGSWESWKDTCSAGSTTPSEESFAASQHGQVLALLLFRFRSLRGAGGEALPEPAADVDLLDMLAVNSLYSLIPKELLAAHVQYGACSHLLRGLAECDGRMTPEARAAFLRKCQDVLVSRASVWAKSVSVVCVSLCLVTHAHPVPSSLLRPPPAVQSCRSSICAAAADSGNHIAILRQGRRGRQRRRGGSAGRAEAGGPTHHAEAGKAAV